MKTRWQYVVLGVLFCWALSAQLSSSLSAVQTYLNRHQNLELPFVRVNDATIIRFVPPRYRSSGLQRGDDILSLDGQAATGRQLFENYPSHLHPGQVLQVKVRRLIHGEYRLFDIPVRMQPLMEDTLDWANVLGLQVVLPISCLLIGFYIAFARPEDPIAWITMAMLTSFGQAAFSNTTWALPSPWRESLFIYHPLLANSWPLWLVLFGLYFPIPSPFLNRHRWLPWSLAVIPGVLFVLDAYGNFALGKHMREMGWMAQLSFTLNRPIALVFTLYIFSFFRLLTVKTRGLANPDAQRRIRLMIIGCTLALVPLLPVALSQIHLLPHLAAWLQTCLLLMMLLFPATMAYVIVVQRAMDVRMVVRSGVKYAIASQSIRILRLILLVGLGVIITLTLAGNRAHPAEGIVIALLGIALIIGIRRLSVSVNRWMDRRFFREAYNAEIILTELSNSVATIRDVSLLVETVASRIAASLHVERIAVLLGRGDVFQPVYALGFGSEFPAEFRPSRSTVQTVTNLGLSARIYFDDPQSWVHGTPARDQEALQRLDAQVLLPVTRKSRLMGLISLGPKRSEAPYSREDLQLLGALASQTGLALENAELTESIRLEVAARERSNRELEIAREVQQRLFPQTLPVIAGLDFAGYCRPALEVGGDYYDFIRLAGNGLGIAVGDVSGKGIAAALMMASLQACLRGQALNAPSTLAQLVTNINTLVYEASAANRYATFFYAQYDPATRQLHYVNAGHNAPVLYRYQAVTQEFSRLDEGGTVIGLFPSVPFRESEVTLQAGDVLVAFTDGISEAMNLSDGEYGEERLLETLRECQGCAAAETVSRLMKSVDLFTDGAPQHDDMTLVVARVL